jgi:hypothetical protein
MQITSKKNFKEFNNALKFAVLNEALIRVTKSWFYFNSTNTLYFSKLDNVSIEL